ncbi:MAG: NTP transferase domain-containing protein [Candidatus Lokiarchaeota archaeon]|nr:NTP transferase domain-containing protein [Candidatus Lokiarchaeota archaeon]
MKAVILAAGKGKRLRPITATKPKPMIPLAGKPLLEHTVLSLKNAGIDHVLIITGYKEEAIKDYFKDGIDKVGIKISYITQTEHLGTAHATNYARNFVKNDEFLLMYGDILVDEQVFKDVIELFKKHDLDGVICLNTVDNPQDFGIITLDSQMSVINITEKPDLGKNLGNLANAGIYVFKPNIFEAIEKTKKSVRGELEFTDSMQILINELNGKIKGHIIKNLFWSDIGLPWQLLDANKYLLDRLNPSIEGTVENNVTFSGTIYVGNKSTIKAGTTIIGPCFIGANTLVGPNAFIRPYSFIGNNCHIGMSEIKNSLIFSNSKIPHFNYVGDSIICENVNLGAGTKVSNLRFDNKSIKMRINGKLINSKRRKLGVVMGANSQTGINVSIMCGKKIGENSIIGANTLINEDVPRDSLYYQDSNGNLIKKTNLS